MFNVNFTSCMVQNDNMFPIYVGENVCTMFEYVVCVDCT